MLSGDGVATFYLFSGTFAAPSRKHAGEVVQVESSLNATERCFPVAIACTKFVVNDSRTGKIQKPACLD